MNLGKLVPDKIHNLMCDCTAISSISNMDDGGYDLQVSYLLKKKTTKRKELVQDVFAIFCRFHRFHVRYLKHSNSS